MKWLRTVTSSFLQCQLSGTVTDLRFSLVLDLVLAYGFKRCQSGVTWSVEHSSREQRCSFPGDWEQGWGGIVT